MLYATPVSMGPDLEKKQLNSSSSCTLLTEIFSCLNMTNMDRNRTSLIQVASNVKRCHLELEIANALFKWLWRDRCFCHF
jgi:hypothetical protein